MTDTYTEFIKFAKSKEATPLQVGHSGVVKERFMLLISQ